MDGQLRESAGVWRIGTILRKTRIAFLWTMNIRGSETETEDGQNRYGHGLLAGEGLRLRQRLTSLDVHGARWVLV